MKKMNVLEPYRVGARAISSATEAALLILRIDDIIASKSTSNMGGMPGGGQPPGGIPPGMM